MSLETESQNMCDRNIRNGNVSFKRRGSLTQARLQFLLETDKIETVSVRSEIQKNWKRVRFGKNNLLEPINNGKSFGHVKNVKNLKHRKIDHHLGVVKIGNFVKFWKMRDPLVGEHWKHGIMWLERLEIEKPLTGNTQSSQYELLTDVEELLRDRCLSFLAPYGLFYGLFMFSYLKFPTVRLLEVRDAQAKRNSVYNNSNTSPILQRVCCESQDKNKSCESEIWQCPEECGWVMGWLPRGPGRAPLSHEPWTKNRKCY